MPTKFDFISPGVELREIDESQVPTVPANPGILLIGRARSGPAMKPIRVKSQQDFTSIFGDAMDGAPQGDPWRNGNTTAPNYAAYAAQAYLAANVGPVNFIRLLGKQKNDTTANRAGWSMLGALEPNTVNGSGSLPEVGGAFGLFLVPSGSQAIASTKETTEGVLAAIFYVSGAAVALEGNLAADPSPGPGYGRHLSTYFAVSASALIQSDSANYGFTAAITSSSGLKRHSFDFLKGGGKYIRDVFNTDPTKFFNNSNYGGTNVPYFLGETFDVNVTQMIASSSAAGGIYGFIAGLEQRANSIGFDDFRQELAGAKSGWFIGPRPSNNYLFRITALDEGTEFERNYYCRIRNITPATANQPNASFSIDIMRRAANGRLADDYAEETYAGVNLNVNSPDYILNRIGSQYLTWNTSKNKWDVNGNYPNISNLVRVEVASTVTQADIPVGFVGPAVPATQTVTGSNLTVASTLSPGWIIGSSSIGMGNSFKYTDVALGDFIAGFPNFLTASIKWPTFGMTTDSTYTNNQNYPASSYFGFRHVRKAMSSWDYSFADLALLRVAQDPQVDAGASFSAVSFLFTLDDIVSASAGAATYYWNSGSYGEAGSVSYWQGLTGSTTSLMDGLGIRQFDAPFFGGADGTDIRYANPFSNERIGNSTDGYPNYTLGLALDMIADRDMIRYELASMPGIINPTRVDDLISTVGTRGDALAIVDVQGIWQPIYDVAGSSVQEQSITTVINTLTNRQLNSSYACTYFPNIRINTTNGNFIAPPSLAGIGAIAKSEADSQPWFAPAGFNRGGISRLGGSNGPSVAGTIEHLTKKERDDLYTVKVNPIARFPATGDTVIFGQRTLQVEASALDRINVRRLMIYLKRHIGDIADTILFDQNVQATWNRFKASADRVLASVQTNLGIVEYKLVLDNSTTTADLIDRNIMYAKIFVKPARAIEFIVVDFIITRSGVEF